MTDLRALYGTDQPPAPYEVITHGPVSFALQSGALRHIRLNGVEIIRSIAFLVRDRDWGTIDPQICDITREDAKTLRLRIPMRFRNGAAQLDVAILIELRADGLHVTAQGQVQGDFETNRTGFTVLHPIEGVAGAPATVTHSDGSREEKPFPLLIEPWQPFMDIAALEHRTGALAIRCSFTGDTFEMEDQRQWGDASFKTYNRPLALPWPYVLADGQALTQSVRLGWTDAAPAGLTEWAAPPSDPAFPEMALVLTAADAAQQAQAIAAIRKVAPQRLLCHVDAGAGPVAPQFAAFAALQQALPDPSFDLELICRFDGQATPEQELTAQARAMRQAGFRPASVFVCPSVDRQSTPPGSDWPDCPPLAQIHEATAAAFPDLPCGGGMASFFPELNRKRPPVGLLDFVSHGLCPIVHAADDISVMETLEAVPHIARSARAIVGDRAYRIGPATIAMRQNPYGSRVIPNPQGGRVCMTDDDPRHRADFGAAYALGLATALAPFDAQVWTPAAVLGPRGVEGCWPITEVLAALARCAGRPVRDAGIAGGIASLTLGTTRFRANLVPQPNAGLPPFGWDQQEL